MATRASNSFRACRGASWTCGAGTLTLALLPTLSTNVCSCRWVVIGAVASSTPGRNPTPNPTRGRPDLAATHPPPLVGNLVDEDPRHHHPRRRRLGRLRAARRPARPVADHDRWPVRDGGGGAAGDRRGVGSAMTPSGRRSGAVPSPIANRCSCPEDLPPTQPTDSIPTTGNTLRRGARPSAHESCRDRRFRFWHGR